MPRPLLQRVRFHAALRGVTVAVLDETSTPPEQAESIATTEPESESPLPEGGDVETDPPLETKLDTSHLEDLLREVAEALEELERRRAASLRELQDVAVELAVAIAAHVLQQKVDHDQLNIASLVSQAVEQLAGDEAVEICIHPEDEASLKNNLPSFAQTVSVATDATLPRGGCRVTAGDFGLLSTLQQRLATIREHLLKGVEYAQFERRETQANDRGLRRFPERRQTA